MSNLESKDKNSTLEEEESQVLAPDMTILILQGKIADRALLLEAEENGSLVPFYDHRRVDSA